MDTQWLVVRRTKHKIEGAWVEQDGRCTFCCSDKIENIFVNSVNIITIFVYLSYMSHTIASNITAEQLKVILDEKLDQKLTPLNLKVSELGSKLEDAMRFL